MRGLKKVDGVTAKLMLAEKIAKDPTQLNEMDAIIFGTPTYMGSVAAPFKAMMDASSKVWMHQNWKDKIAAGFTNSHSMSGDKLNTLMQLVVFAMQHGMIWVGQSELNQSPETEAGHPEKINRLGSFVGAMAQSDNRDPIETPPFGDLETAAQLGQRVGRITMQMKKGEK
ncbi:MAG: flavodoxin [Gammaproteobacteria bacterium]|nr:flavodoxin [Gammaproteobacteria bacterium]